ncbi:AAA family ATPase [Citrobacter farmeri]|uniref:AAA family ATPase n=1 Tax=Citrobacter farmeri TaxID=67824 RepID=UPI001905A2B7|nr:ATP-binding protein [Citrobacter farmeri]EKV7298623.1 AAA family ATPase [Citrobacter farmeri]MBJ8745957.1 AAA family ATPase [Citrobacter farmeri]MBJ8759208.1 AAA family ATPase [Citrobacter farmeri]MBJ9019009.1 AAA family ATPase [Citrobacter farmeri]
MIHWYKFKNFYSFKDETKVDFTLKKNSSRSSLDATIGTIEVSKVTAVMGANGSGKSNLLKPLAFLSWFTNRSFKDLDSNDVLPCQGHASSKNEPTKMEIMFDIYFYEKDDFCRCNYVTEFDHERIIHERLKMEFDDGWHLMFNRRLSKRTNKYIVKTGMIPDDTGTEIEIFDEKELASVPFNASTISYFSRKDHWVAKRVAIEFDEIYTNLGSAGKQHFSYSKVLIKTKFYKDNNDLFELAKKFMRKMDFGLEDIILKEETFHNPDNEKPSLHYTPYGVHKNGNERFEIPFYLESSGTQACYNFIADLLCAFDTGGIAVIDELDSDLHPLMVNEIIDMFTNEYINPKNAQLIFSCHSPEVLKMLKKHHVYLVEKNDGESYCWRLDEMTGLRSQDNLYNKYITGALGAVPDISL